MKTALLLSGGADSIAIAYWKKPEAAITVDYGQLPAAAEIRASKAITDALNIKHYVIKADLSSLGSGDLAGNTSHVLAPVPEWWPFRNQMLVTLAAMKAIQMGYMKLLIGCLSTDKFHADGTPAFVDGLDNLLACQEGGMRLEAPAISLTATELIKKSKIPLDLLSWAHSCHTSEFACGQCRGCRKHYEIMESLGENPY